VTGQELLDFLGQWLIKHVIHSDKHAANYLRR
jgi:hemerythrin